jgi:hypothetical protein
VVERSRCIGEPAGTSLEAGVMQESGESCQPR